MPNQWIAVREADRERECVCCLRYFEEEEKNSGDTTNRQKKLELCCETQRNHQLIFTVWAHFTISIYLFIYLSSSDLRLVCFGFTRCFASVHISFHFVVIIIFSFSFLSSIHCWNGSWNWFSERELTTEKWQCNSVRRYNLITFHLFVSTLVVFFYGWKRGNREHSACVCVLAWESCVNFNEYFACARVKLNHRPFRYYYIIYWSWQWHTINILKKYVRMLPGSLINTIDISDREGVV